MQLSAWQKCAVYLSVLSLMATLLCLSALAAPTRSGAAHAATLVVDEQGNVAKNAKNVDGIGGNAPKEGENVPSETLPPDAADAPRDAAEARAVGAGGTITAVLCVLAAVTLILILVAIMPHRRSK